jgi:hypothetical protein
VEDVFWSFMAQIKKSALLHPKVKFGLVQPMLRPRHGWYTEGYEALCGMYNDNIKAMGLENVARIDGSPGCTQLFDKDGVHLTEASGKVFLETIIANAETFFTQEIIELENEKMDESGESGNQISKAEWITKRIVTVEREIGRLNKDLEERGLQDS